jgi:hypothetical protein
MSDEIDQLQHELAMLRARYEIIERNGRWARAFCRLSLIPIGCVAVYALWKDFVAAAFGIALVAIVLVLARFLQTEKARWIDVGTPGGEGFGPSEARKVESAIAQREKRLAELR